MSTPLTKEASFVLVSHHDSENTPRRNNVSVQHPNAILETRNVASSIATGTTKLNRRPPPQPLPIPRPPSSCSSNIPGNRAESSTVFVGRESATGGGSNSETDPAPTRHPYHLQSRTATSVSAHNKASTNNSENENELNFIAKNTRGSTYSVVRASLPQSPTNSVRFAGRQMGKEMIGNPSFRSTVIGRGVQGQRSDRILSPSSSSGQPATPTQIFSPKVSFINNVHPTVIVVSSKMCATSIHSANSSTVFDDAGSKKTGGGNDSTIVSAPTTKTNIGITNDIGIAHPKSPSRNTRNTAVTPTSGALSLFFNVLCPGCFRGSPVSEKKRKRMEDEKRNMEFKQKERRSGWCKVPLLALLAAQIVVIAGAFTASTVVTGTMMRAASKDLARTNVDSSLRLAATQISAPIKAAEAQLKNARTRYYTTRGFLGAEPCSDSSISFQDSASFYSDGMLTVESVPEILTLYHIGVTPTIDPDFVSRNESIHRAVRGGIFQASRQLSICAAMSKRGLYRRFYTKQRFVTTVPTLNDYGNLDAMRNISLPNSTAFFGNDPHMLVGFTSQDISFTPFTYSSTSNGIVTTYFAGAAPLFLNVTNKTAGTPPQTVSYLEFDYKKLARDPHLEIVVLSTLVASLTLKSYFGIMQDVTIDYDGAHTSLYRLVTADGVGTSGSSVNGTDELLAARGATAATEGTSSSVLFSSPVLEQDAAAGNWSLLTDTRSSVLLATSYGDQYWHVSPSKHLYGAGLTPSTELNSVFWKTLQLLTFYNQTSGDGKRASYVEQNTVRMHFGAKSITSGLSFRTGSGLTLLVVQSTPNGYYFETIQRVEVLSIVIGVVAAAAIIGVCLFITLSVWMTIESLLENMALAASFKNDRVVHTESFLSETQLLSEGFDLMNDKLLEARGYLPQHMLLTSSSESEEEQVDVDEDAEAEAEAHHVRGIRRRKDYDEESYVSTTSMSTRGESESSATFVSRDGRTVRSLKTGDGTTRLSTADGNGRTVRHRAQLVGKAVKKAMAQRKSGESFPELSSGGKEESARPAPANAIAMASKRVTIVSLNVRGFYSRVSAGVGGSPADQVSKLAELVHALADAQKGVIDSFHGDHFVVSFNAARSNADGAAKAAKMALEIVGELNAGSGTNGPAMASVGISTGRAFVGNMGTATLKRLSIIGPVYSKAIALERLCAARFNFLAADASSCDMQHTHIQVLADELVVAEVQHAVVVQLLGALTGPPFSAQRHPSHADQPNATLSEHLQSTASDLSRHLLYALRAVVARSAEDAAEEWMYELQLDQKVQENVNGDNDGTSKTSERFLNFTDAVGGIRSVNAAVSEYLYTVAENIVDSSENAAVPVKNGGELYNCEEGIAFTKKKIGGTLPSVPTSILSPSSKGELMLFPSVPPTPTMCNLCASNRDALEALLAAVHGIRHAAQKRQILIEMADHSSFMYINGAKQPQQLERAKTVCNPSSTALTFLSVLSYAMNLAEAAVPRQSVVGTGLGAATNDDNQGQNPGVLTTTACDTCILGVRDSLFNEALPRGFFAKAKA